MSMRRKATAVVALVCAAVLGLSAPAMAVPQVARATSVDVIGIAVKTGSTTAQIFVRYTCTGTPDQIHIWASVKQSADRTADPRLAEEGSGYGGVAAAWSQTHIGSPICNGWPQIGTFTVDQQEAGYGTLERGWAYIQFCLFDANYVEAPIWDFEFKRLI